MGKRRGASACIASSNDWDLAPEERSTSFASRIDHKIAIEKHQRLPSQAVACFRGLECVNIIQLDKGYRNFRRVKLIVEFLGLRERHFLILRAMHDEEWRIRFVHVVDRRRPAPHVGEFGEVSAKEAGQKGVSV